MSIEIKCDRCGKDIEGVFMQVERTTSDKKEMFNNDLCGLCTLSYQKWFKQGSIIIEDVKTITPLNAPENV